jgi:hypothetical protein
VNIQQGNVVISGAGNTTEILRAVNAGIRNNTEGITTTMRQILRGGGRF